MLAIRDNQAPMVTVLVDAENVRRSLWPNLGLWVPIIRFRVSDSPPARPLRRYCRPLGDALVGVTVLLGVPGDRQPVRA